MRAWLVQLDQRALAGVRAWRTPPLTAFFKVLTQLGAPGAFAVLGGLLWWLATPFSLELLRRLSAAGVAWAVVEVVKRVARRQRPSLALADHHALIANPDAHSFPSGHTATTIAAAVAMAGVDTRVTVAGAVLAPLISFSRVYLGVHFPLDVLAGALIGIACGLSAPALLFGP